VPEPWDETSGDAYNHSIDQTAFALSDVVSFHAYCGPKRLARIIDHLETFGRPLLITEWMARHIGSRIGTHLPIFRQKGIGCFQWGLVQGRTQTYLPWPTIEAKTAKLEARPDEWFHDVLRADGEAYDLEETDVIRKLAVTRMQSSCSRPNHLFACQEQLSKGEQASYQPTAGVQTTIGSGRA